jgi:hypothetical protein
MVQQSFSTGEAVRITGVSFYNIRSVDTRSLTCLHCALRGSFGKLACQHSRSAESWTFCARKRA